MTATRERYAELLVSHQRGAEVADADGEMTLDREARLLYAEIINGAAEFVPEWAFLPDDNSATLGAHLGALVAILRSGLEVEEPAP